MKQLSRKILVLLSLSLLMLGGSLAACKTPAPKPKRPKKEQTNKSQKEKAFDKFEAALKKQMKKDKIPGASISVLQDGKPIYSKGFGLANIEKMFPVTSDTLFSTGSIGKMYAATVVLKLVQDGKMALDEPITTYIPDFKMDDPRYRAITVRMLLNNSSGLPRDGDASGVDWVGSMVNDNFGSETVPLLAKQRLKATPGDLIAYSNTGFTLIQVAIENVTQQGFGEYLKKEFLEPMGLTNTVMNSEKGISDDRFARGYDAFGNRLPREYSAPGSLAAGAM